jgi:hypothetical protein
MREALSVLLAVQPVRHARDHTPIRARGCEIFQGLLRKRISVLW